MARGMAAAAASLLFLAACGGKCPSAKQPKCPSPEAAKAGDQASAAGEAPEDPAKSGLRDVPPVPEGYVEMHALLVAPAGDGNAVLIGDEARTVFIPIMIGGTEAIAIMFRLKNENFPRPVTHDLLDRILHQLGSRLVKVQVDELKDSVFIGSVYIRYQGEIIEFDARPSDAIALAVGNDVPIYVAKSVVEQAGISRDDLGGGDVAPPVQPPAPDLPGPLRPSK